LIQQLGSVDGGEDGSKDAGVLGEEHAAEDDEPHCHLCAVCALSKVAAFGLADPRVAWRIDGQAADRTGEQGIRLDPSDPSAPPDPSAHGQWQWGVLGDG
tara:strand:+ start:182 stop:481 length:300 start_codon:yes stop_codon:yes gene_type:complete